MILAEINYHLTRELPSNWHALNALKPAKENLTQTIYEGKAFHVCPDRASLRYDIKSPQKSASSVDSGRDSPRPARSQYYDDFKSAWTGRNDWGRKSQRILTRKR